ncbi:hypothetical protein NLI96_g5418 [Meripilus lineatus]|uniref:Uncharacterized protein n=1 Tax=Meripilus lineatus TaxID=2056292 RepID=A0AAD5V7P5_9APHY|nr:hypothetical protein NLI96_g5418 [Physisporinus lineatus]
MYEYPVPSSSSLSPPSPPKRHRHINNNLRSNSPVPRIATLLPGASHSQYSPSSRASDISRLLDPTYTSASSSSSSPESPSRAYVDHRGDLHDPDYRDFPILRPTRRSKSSMTRKQRRTSGSSHRSHSATRSDRFSAYPLAVPSRPSWERDWNAEILDDEDEDEMDADLGDATDVESQSHSSPFYSPSSRLSYTSRLPPPYPTAYSSHYYGEPIIMSSSPISISEDNALQLISSPFEETEFDAPDMEEDERPKSRRSCLIRKSSARHNKKNKEKDIPQVDKEQADLDQQEDRPVVEDSDFV